MGGSECYPVATERQELCRCQNDPASMDTAPGPYWYCSSALRTSLKTSRLPSVLSTKIR